MRKYITIPFDEYIRNKNKKQDISLTNTERVLDASTVSTHSDNEEGDVRDSPSNGPPSSESSHSSPRRRPSPPHLQSYTDPHPLPVPVVGNNIDTAQFFSSSPIPTTAGTSHPERSNSHFAPTVPVDLPDQIPVGSDPVVNPISNSSPHLSQQKKKRKKTPHLLSDQDQYSDQDTKSERVEKSLYQGEAGKENLGNHRYNQDIFSEKVQNVYPIQNFDLQKVEDPIKDSNCQLRGNPKSGQSSLEGCSSSFSEKSNSSPRGLRYEGTKHHHKKYQRSADPVQDSGESYSPEIFVQHPSGGQNKSHSFHQLPHQSQPHLPLNSEELRNATVSSARSSLNSDAKSGWGDLWNVENAYNISLKRKAEHKDEKADISHGDMESDDEIALQSDVRHTVLEKGDGEKSKSVEQRSPLHRTPLVTQEHSAGVEKNPAPQRRSLPPPGIPAEMKKKKIRYRIKF